jgi:hypothetical protein
MPAQTSGTTGTIYVGEGDTFPIPLTLLAGDNTPIDLTDAFLVRIWIAYMRAVPYFSPTAYIVEARPCTIVDADQGLVSYTPLANDLTPPGLFHYQFRVTWNDNSIQTIPSHYYPTLQILTPVIGRGSLTGVP